MKHKHAEILHAIADGIPVQWWSCFKKDWVDFDEEKYTHPHESDKREKWRIKPAEVPQWRKDMAQALKDGKVVECWNGAWETSGYKAEHFLDPERFINTQQWYRIRPEPDVVKYLLYTQTAGWVESFIPGGPTKTIKIIRDANGNLKDAEVL